jgi:hypothetical protein
MRIAVPVGAVAVAAIAIASAYLIAHTDSTPSSKSPASTFTAASGPSYPTPVLNGALSPETGPDGTSWQWIGATASVELPGPSPSWLAFRALSPRIARTLTLTGPSGERAGARVRTAPSVYLLGPFSPGRAVLRAAPVQPATAGRPPALAVFLSALRVMPNAVAAVPGTGFWSTESSGGVVFNWMRGTAAIDVYAPQRATGQAWLTFIARSLGQPRTLTAVSGASRAHLSVSTRPRSITVGPFALARGRTTVLLLPAPGPRRYGNDPRALSVQIAGLGGFTRAASKP